MTEFRAACYELTGFTIDRTDTLFKLQSVFAERKEDYLLFKARTTSCKHLHARNNTHVT